MKISTPLIVSTAALLCACSTATPSPSPAPGPAQSAAPADSAGGRTRTNRDVLTEQEILAANVTTHALDAVQRLRPQWLRIRGSPTVPETDGTLAIQAWLNGRHLGDVQTLRDIPVGQIIELRWLDPITARNRYGPGNSRGVVDVTGR